MKHLSTYTLLCSFFLFMCSCERDDIIQNDLSCEEKVDMVSFNRLQVIGSHNSYRIRPNEAILQLITASAGQLPPDFTADSWDYNHVSLNDQFSNYGVRSVEIDVYRDPDGGLFHTRKGNALVGLDPDSMEDELLQPGLKVMHFPDFDYLSHHLTFKGTLDNIKQWSEAHPNHVPITILVEAKEDSPDQLLPGYGLTTSLAFDQNGVEEIEMEINDVFSGNMSHLFTPDELRGSASTLNDAVKAGNWPSLSEMRGRLIFVLMGSDAAIDHYIPDHSSLQGRNMFVFTVAGTPESVFIKMDDPIANFGLIQQRIAEGYVVRTRADADTKEARNGDYTRFMASINSGAQIISTDYYKHYVRAMSDMGWTDYEVSFENDVIAKLHDTISADPFDCEVIE